VRKRIIKNGVAPASYTVWLQGGSAGVTPEWEAQIATGDWSLLPNPEKQAVHKELLAEQGSLCCYCQSRIVRRKQLGATVDDGSHIEHLLPREHFPHLTFAYANMAASRGKVQAVCGRRCACALGADCATTALMRPTNAPVLATNVRRQDRFFAEQNPPRPFVARSMPYGS
jgi:uncharacterized protein (TIGR02646 family)